jgi:Fe2+ or Zn2+ uptake regulation protein
MTGPRDSNAARVAEHIVQYLREHVDAADTADGILTWWLENMPTPSLRTVRRALALLVADGLIERHTLPDGTVVYRSPR